MRTEAFAAVGGFDSVVRFPGEEERVALDLAAAGWGLAYVDDVDRPPPPLPEAAQPRRAAGRDLAQPAAHRRHAAAAARRRPDVRPRAASGRAGAAGWSTPAGRAGGGAAPPGHPALAAGASAGCWSRPRERGAADPRVAVVVITHQRRDELLGALGRLRALPEQPHVVVVDNGSTDGTADAVRERFPEVELVASPENLGAVGRNVGVARLDTPFVAFCDDDTWWDPGSLSLAADTLERLPAAGGRDRPDRGGAGGREDPIVAELRDSPVRGAGWLPGPALGSFLAGASVLRREAFLEVGGFSERLWLGGEEELMAGDLAAAGWELCYLPGLTVHHQASRARDAHNAAATASATPCGRRGCAAPAPGAAPHRAPAAHPAARPGHRRAGCSPPSAGCRGWCANGGCCHRTPRPGSPRSTSCSAGRPPAVT